MLENLRLDDRAAVVTGSGRGLGRAMAKALAKAGANVVVASRTREQVDETVAQITNDDGCAIACPTDVTGSSAVNALAGRCVDEFSGRAIRFTISKRAGKPEDIGPMAVWLSGTGAGFVTGQIFAVDGAPR